jgi:predicted AAA+ superfamily ATPase
LYDRLPEIVSSSVTIKRLAFDLEVAFESVKSWFLMFENLYACFRVAPYGLPKIHAVKKQQKLFLWDWARVEEPGPRLENMVALHLLRLVHWAEDVWGERLELRYYRDQQGHEVDFLLMHKRAPLAAIEVKSSQQEIDRGLTYFLSKVRVPFAFQIHLKGKDERLIKTKDGAKVWVMPASRLLNGLG